MFLSKVVPLALLFVSGVWAQFEMAECGVGFEWNRNSLGQDACLVGSMLDAACRGLAVYTYPPLNSSQYYIPPREGNAGDLTCDCNTVMYNLYMSCALCQGGQIYAWPAWIVACPNVYVTQFPADIAQGTAIPRWAFFNVTSLPDQTFNQTTSITIGRDPEALPSPVIITSGSSTSGKNTLSLDSTGQPSPSSDFGVPKSGTNVGAIVGGVVGSVVPLTILGVVAFFYMRRRRQQGSGPQQQMQNPDGPDPYKQYQPASMYGPPPTSAPLTPYNPSDPSTFPPQSPQSSVTYTTPAHNMRGAYSGAPEV